MTKKTTAKTATKKTAARKTAKPAKAKAKLEFSAIADGDVLQNIKSGNFAKVEKLTKTEASYRMLKDGNPDEPYGKVRTIKPEQAGLWTKAIRADVTTKPAAAKPNPKPSAGKKPVAKPAAKKKADGKMSQLDAAAKVLKETGDTLNCQSLIDAMAEKGYWTSPGGKTPAATLSAAIGREIATKGTDSRFTKVDRGLYADAHPTKG